MITLYDAARCPYCARVRIVLAEKGVPYETVVVDLKNRPAWIYEKNATGRVPVLEEDTFVLPESHLIMDYLEERYPEPALAPRGCGRACAGASSHRSLRRRARRRLLRVPARRGENKLEQRLDELEVTRLPYGLAAIAYVPWVIRARDLLGVGLPAQVEAWLGALAERPAIRAELEVVAAL